MTAARAISETLRIPWVRQSSRKCSYSSGESRKLTILLLAFMDMDILRGGRLGCKAWLIDYKVIARIHD